MKQPDGTEISLRLWGDEFHQIYESTDGYTLIRDPLSREFCYAKLSEDGSELVSTGVPLGEADPSDLGIDQGIRINKEAAKAKKLAAREQFVQGYLELGLGSDIQPRDTLDSGVGVTITAYTPGESLNGAPCNGNVRGITIILDFPDQAGTVLPSDVEDFCNAIDWGGYGGTHQTNYPGSVRDFFRDVSDGNLDYTCHVSDEYYTTPQLKQYYIDGGYNTIPPLVEGALEWLDKTKDVDFTQFDSNGDGNVDALNVFYTGTVSGGGLWPHAWGLYYRSEEGIVARRYQISGMSEGSKTLGIGTFCHENGHMLCWWPDLYDYDGDSKGAGRYCNMAHGGAEPCPPFKYIAGWATATELTTPQSGIAIPTEPNTYFTYTNPSLTKEFFLIANQQLVGREANTLPDTGLSIWHVDWQNGSNNNQEMTPASHYYITLEQADGRWDLENNRNTGDSSDFFDAGSYNMFAQWTDPDSQWWSGSVSSLYISEISSKGSTMTFKFGISSGEPGEINVSPMSLDFGDQDVDLGPSATQQITITNLHGTNSIRFVGISLTGDDAGHFGIASDTGEEILEPGESRLIQINFDPTVPGIKTADLTIISNDDDEPIVDVALTGNGFVLPIIRDITCNTSSNIEITFAKPGKSFTIESSTSPYDYDEENMVWNVEASGLPSGTWEDTGTPVAGEKYYHVFIDGTGTGLISYEPFDYPAGEYINSQNGNADQWGGAWVGPPVDMETEIVAPGLIYPQVPTMGNAVQMTIFDDRTVPERPLKQSISSGTAWMSFVFKFTDGWADFYICVNEDDLMVGPWFSNDAWLGYNNGNFVHSGVDILDGEVHFLVLRMDFNPGSLDGYLWIDPEMSLGEPSTGEADASVTNPNPVVWETLNMVGSTGLILVLDEFRIGGTWNSVIGAAPEERETVGMMVKSLVLGRNIVSPPFEPYPEGGGTPGSSTLDKIVGIQLTGHAVSQWASDKIEAWDADLQTYLGAWLRAGEGWKAWDTMDTSPAFGIDSDAGYWIKINNVVKDVKLFGRVAKENRSIEIKMNRNMVGSCFPVSCPLTESNLIGSLMTGHPVSQWASDKLEFWNAAAQTYVGVWYRAGQGWRAWDSMDNPPAAPYDAIDPCEGWWIKVNNTPFMWDYPKPD